MNMLLKLKDWSLDRLKERTSLDGIGLIVLCGSVILFGGIGALIGPFYLPLVLLFGSLSSLIIYLMLWKKSTSDEIPLGSGLVCGFFVYVFLSFYELMDNLIVL